MTTSFSIKDFCRVLYIICLAITPAYFGGERLFSWIVLAIMQSTILFLSTFSTTRELSQNTFSNSLYRLSVLFATLVIAWTIIQCLPLSQNMLGNPIWSLSSNELGQESDASISVTPDESFITTYKFVTILFAYINARALFTRQIWANRLLHCLVGIGATYAAFGLFRLYAYPDSHVWLLRNPYGSSLVSTFVNRNTFAMYLSLNLIVCLALILQTEHSAGRRIRSIKQLIVYNLTQKLPKNFILFGAYSIQMTALILTGSRAGIGFAIVSQFSLVFMQAFRNRKSLFLSFVSLFTIGAVASYLFTRYSQFVDGRSMAIDESLKERMSLYAQIWEAIQDRPLTGYGLGAFENVFRYHKSIDFDPEGIWLRAHNAYLEAMLALGIPFAFVLMFTCILPLIALIKADGRNHSAPALAVIVMTLNVAFHSLFDFGIQAASNALLLFGMIGVAVGCKINLPKHNYNRKLN